MKKRSGAFIRRFWPLIAALAVLVGVLALRSRHPLVVVKGLSMEPTYRDGELLFCSRIRDPSEISVGDVVVARPQAAGLERVIKRVIGCPGDTVPADIAGSELLLGKNEFYLCGDNRDNSVDSRTYGPVLFEDIQFRVNGG